MRHIDANTRLYLLLGDPVSHSLSPALYNAAFEESDLNACYLACRVGTRSLGEAVAGMRVLNIAGGNVTAPFKEEAVHFVDRLSSGAEIIKSVNTLVNRDGCFWGYTTDGPGFCRSLREKLGTPLSGCRVLLVGAGGAARAVAYSLAVEGVRNLVIANRTGQRARELVETLVKYTPLKRIRAVSLTPESLREEMAKCQVVINCLPLDSRELLSAMTDPSLLLQGCYFADLRYSPGETELMKVFIQRGGQAFNGKGMLLWQAVYAYELFAGIQAPVEKMRDIIGSW